MERRRSDLGEAPRRESPWARFMAQETGLQKVLVATAAMVTAVATIAAGGIWLYRVSGIGSDEPKDPTPAAGDLFETAGAPVDVEQGSAEADALVRAFVEAGDERIVLNAMVHVQEIDVEKQFHFNLFYNCVGLEDGESPGPDRCSNAFFKFEVDPVPIPYERPARVELSGVWANGEPTRGYGAGDLVIAPVPIS